LRQATPSTPPLDPTGNRPVNAGGRPAACPLVGEDRPSPEILVGRTGVESGPDSRHGCVRLDCFPPVVLVAADPRSKRSLSRVVRGSSWGGRRS
jgi:hypothetical protein